jgi:dolichol-phosphate mannosyltransferase
MQHWFRFNLVGAAGFAVQTAALHFLTQNTLFHLHYLVATVAAVEFAVLNNFVWHQKWTWSDRPCETGGQVLWRMAAFNLTNGVVSIAGNLLLMGLFVGWLRLPIAGSNVLSVAVCGLSNFVIANRVVFARQRPVEPAPLTANVPGIGHNLS